MTDPESSQVLPPLGAKPSLVAGSTAAQRDGRSEDSSIRMLDAIGSKPGKGGVQRLPAASPLWIAAALLAVIAAGGAWWMNRDATTPGIDESAVTTTTPTAMAADARTASVDAAAAPLTTPAASGAATIERTGVAVAVASPNQPAPGKVPASAPGPASSVAASMPGLARSAPKLETRLPMAGVAQVPPAVAPPQTEPSQRDAVGARDADVTLLTAMLARLSRNAAEGQAAETQAAIGTLLARCEGRSAEDPAGAIKCRQELCANLRGPVAACTPPLSGQVR